MLKIKLEILSIAASWVLYVLMFWAVNPLVIAASEFILANPEVGFSNMVAALGATIALIIIVRHAVRRALLLR